jgi:hypothetical protein
MNISKFKTEPKVPFSPASPRNTEDKVVFYFLYSLFWVIPRLLNFICRRFGTLCLFHLHRRCKAGTVYFSHVQYNLDESVFSWATYLLSKASKRLDNVKRHVRRLSLPALQPDIRKLATVLQA